MWGERMAGDKEGYLKLVLLQKNTSEHTASVLQRIFCITGYWSELSCRPWSTNYKHLAFVSLRPTTCTSCFCWYHTATTYFVVNWRAVSVLGFGRWAFPSGVWGMAASRCPFCFCQKCLSSSEQKGMLEPRLLQVQCVVSQLSNLFSHTSPPSHTTRVTFQALHLLTVRSISFT